MKFRKTAAAATAALCMGLGGAEAHAGEPERFRSDAVVKYLIGDCSLRGTHVVMTPGIDTQTFQNGCAFAAETQAQIARGEAVTAAHGNGWFAGPDRDAGCIAYPIIGGAGGEFFTVYARELPNGTPDVTAVPLPAEAMTGPSESVVLQPALNSDQYAAQFPSLAYQSFSGWELAAAFVPAEGCK